MVTDPSPAQRRDNSTDTSTLKVHAALDLHKGPDLDIIELTDN